MGAICSFSANNINLGRCFDGCCKRSPKGPPEERHAPELPGNENRDSDADSEENHDTPSIGRKKKKEDVLPSLTGFHQRQSNNVTITGNVNPVTNSMDQNAPCDYDVQLN